MASKVKKRECKEENTPGGDVIGTHGGVMWSDAKRSHCYYHDVDYFLITAHPEAFYSSSIKDRDTFCVFIATVVERLRNKFLLTSEQLYNTSISYSIIVLYK